MNLELIAMRWLRWEKRCIAVLCQRSPRSWTCGIPDVLGLTQSRHLIEIEIKRTLSDFRADFKKHSRTLRLHLTEKFPRHFYYMVPPSLADKVRAELPEWAGLMTVGSNEYSAAVLIPSTANPKSERLTIKECMRFFSLLANHLLAAEESKHAIQQWQMQESGPYEFDWHYQI